MFVRVNKGDGTPDDTGGKGGWWTVQPGVPDEGRPGRKAKAKRAKDGMMDARDALDGAAPELEEHKPESAVDSAEPTIVETPEQRAAALASPGVEPVPVEPAAAGDPDSVKPGVADAPAEPVKAVFVEPPPLKTETETTELEPPAQEA
jgi:hypothetical protein